MTTLTKKEIENSKNNSNLNLTDKQKIELSSRIKAYHNNRSIGRKWDEIKKSL